MPPFLESQKVTPFLCNLNFSPMSIFLTISSFMIEAIELINLSFFNKLKLELIEQNAKVDSPIENAQKPSPISCFLVQKVKPSFCIIFC